MTVSGILGWLNIRGLSLALRLPDEIYDGQETIASLRLENRKRLFPSFLLLVELEGTRSIFHLVGRNGAETGTVAVTFRGRGLKQLVRAVVRSPFPINFFVRSTALPLDARCIVFPHPKPCAPPDAPADGRSRGVRESRGRGYDGEVEKIVEYTGAEPFKLVHWRLSARHENLKVKEMTALAEEPLVLDISKLPGRSIEEGLACGAWLVNRSIRANRPVGLITGGRIIPPDTSRTHRLKLLAELALHGSR